MTQAYDEKLADEIKKGWLTDHAWCITSHSLMQAERLAEELASCI